MLPKIWKKLLLAICIIACLFNITAKLVNRISLEKVIASEPEGVDVIELLNIVEEAPVLTTQNAVSNYNVIQDEQIVVEDATQEAIETTNSEEPEEVKDDLMTYITDTSKYTDFLQN